MKLIMFMVAVLISASAHASECASKLNLDTPDFYPNIIHCLQELEKREQTID